MLHVKIPNDLNYQSDQYLFLKVFTVLAFRTCTGILFQVTCPKTGIGLGPINVLVLGTIKSFLTLALVPASCLRFRGSNRCAKCRNIINPFMTLHMNMARWNKRLLSCVLKPKVACISASASSMVLQATFAFSVICLSVQHWYSCILCHHNRIKVRKDENLYPANLQLWMIYQ